MPSWKLLLVAVALLAPFSHALQCYSCSSDDSDQDCDNLAALEKVTCQPFSVDHPVQPVCGHKRLVMDSAGSSERVWRGCAVAGECALLARQGNEAFNSVYRMSECEECGSDHCNGQRSGGTVVGVGLATWVTSVVLVLVKLAQSNEALKTN